MSSQFHGTSTADLNCSGTSLFNPKFQQTDRWHPKAAKKHCTAWPFDGQLGKKVLLHFCRRVCTSLVVFQIQSSKSLSHNAWQLHQGLSIYVPATHTVHTSSWLPLALSAGSERFFSFSLLPHNLDAYEAGGGGTTHSNSSLTSYLAHAEWGNHHFT